tara:strand:+ start:345 stop:971 length:627 start_codon:yes stop_codon:yes gene_type:complete
MAFIIDGTTGIATVDGSVSAPSQRGQDSNSGISYAADTIKFSTNGVERMAITNSGITGITQGKLLQVVHHDLTSTFTYTSTSTADVTGFSKAITPTAAGSKIKVTFSFDYDIENSSNNSSLSFVFINRQVASGSDSDIAGISLGARDVGQGNYYISSAIIHLDDPTYNLGDAITYKMRIRLYQSGGTGSISASNTPRSTHMILEEIAA